MTKRKSFAVAAAVVCAAMSGVVSAQTIDASARGSTASNAAAAQSEGLQEIVVTAQKREESINKVGMSITALTGDSLEQRGVVNVSDLSKVVPGFSYTATPYNSPVYTIRGIGFYDVTLAATPAVTVYTDEIPLPYSAMTKAAALDLERVEVLKGPQGTLFGQNSTGGAINFVAARPTDVLQAGAELSYGRFNDVDFRGFLSGAISDTLKGRLAVRVIHEDAWQYSYTRNDSNGTHDETDARLLLDWRPVDQLSVRVNLNGWNETGETQAPQLLAITPQNPAGLLPLIANYPLPPMNDRAADWSVGVPHKSDSFYQGSLRVDYDLSNSLEVTSITAGQHFKTDSFNDWDGVNSDNVDVSVDGNINSFVQELRMSGDVGPLRWTVGGNYQDDKVVEAQVNYIGSGSTSAAFPGIHLQRAHIENTQKMRTDAAFSNLEFQMTDTVKLQGGVRYTDVKRTFVGCDDTGTGNIYDPNVGSLFALLSSLVRQAPPFVIGPGQCTTLSNTTFLPVLVDNTLQESNVSWRMGVNWQATPDALLYANASRGFKSGGFPTVASSTSNQLNAIPQESVRAYETGFKIAALERRVRFDGAAFYYDYTDKQLRGKILDPIFNLEETLVSVPKSRIWGLEAGITASPIHGLDINIGATHIDSQVKQFVGIGSTGLAADFAGNRFPYTPENQVTGSIQYRWNIAGGLSADVGGGLVYNSATNASIGNEPITRIGGYDLLDLRAGLSSQNDVWRVGLWVRNLTDEYYWTNVTRANDTTVRFTGQPRTFGVSAGYRF